MRIHKIILVLFLLTLLSSAGFAQSDILSGEAAAATEAEFEPLPEGYGKIELGMEIESVKQQLFDDPNFNYRGEPDVSMNPSDNQQVIDCDGLVYVDRGYFQFHEDRLYLITMVLDREYIDHYSIYTALSKKYGEPDYLDPSKTVWEDGRIRLSLERPLSLKYIDLEVFKKIQDESYAESSIESMLRQDFIDSF